MDLLKAHSDQFSPKSYRGVLLSDVLGNTYHKLLRNKLSHYLNKYVSDSQCGCNNNRGTDFASQILNSVSDLARANKSCLLVFFVDLVAAFDNVVVITISSKCCGDHTCRIGITFGSRRFQTKLFRRAGQEHFSRPLPHPGWPRPPPTCARRLYLHRITSLVIS